MPTNGRPISIAPAPGLKPPTGRRFETNLPCRDACPVGTHAGGYVSLIAQGHYREAFLLARRANPFASICGRICSHPCETACRRRQIDEPVGIRSLERFITERYGVESRASHRVAGGMLRSGVPESRLPRDLIEKEINFIRFLGVDIRLGMEIGVDIPFSRLRDEYDAVFLASGQITDPSFLGEGHGLEITPRNAVVVDRATLATTWRRHWC